MTSHPYIHFIERIFPLFIESIIIIHLDQEIKKGLDTINGRLDSLEDTITQQNFTGECPSGIAGNFLNPASNCSHIHPGDISGNRLIACINVC